EQQRFFCLKTIKLFISQMARQSRFQLLYPQFHLLHTSSLRCLHRPTVSPARNATTDGLPTTVVRPATGPPSVAAGSLAAAWRRAAPRARATSPAAAECRRVAARATPRRASAGRGGAAARRCCSR